jgi:hypothetical protein
LHDGGMEYGGCDDDDDDDDDMTTTSGTAAWRHNNIMEHVQDDGTAQSGILYLLLNPEG